MKRLALISLIAVGALLLSACATSTTQSWPGLAADADRAYLASGSFVYAVRISDGTKVWQYPTQAGPQHFYSSPAVTADGIVLVGSAGSDDGLIALDAASGTPKWPAAFTASDRWVAPPLVAGTTVYAVNNNGTLYALSLADGSKQWSLKLGGEMWAAPATNGTLVFVNSLDHNLYAVDPSAVKVAWKVNLGGAAPGGPFVPAAGTTLYTGSFGKKVFAIDEASGNVIWSAATKDWIWGTPALNGNAVIAADISGYIYSFDAATGNTTGPTVQPDGPITGSPLLAAGSFVYGTESGSLVAYSQTGDQSWNAAVGGTIYTSPVAAGTTIVVAPLNTDFLLAGLDQTGKILWKFTGK